MPRGRRLTTAPRKRRTKAEIERAKRKALSARKHHLKTKHRMTLEQYEGIKEFQGGRCYICQRATGAVKELAVDHDHKKAAQTCMHPVNESCQGCWRGILCSTCNKVLGHARDLIAFFQRAIDYLLRPPAQEWLRIQRIERGE